MTSDNSHAREIRIRFNYDESGYPQAPHVPGARLDARLEAGLDFTHDEAGVPFQTVSIRANRDGLLWLAYRCLAMAHTRDHIEGYHVHIVDPVPGATDGRVGVTIYDEAPADGAQ